MKSAAAGLQGINRGLLFLLVATFLWGSGNVAQKLTLAELGPFTVLGLRSLLALVVLLPLALYEERSKPRGRGKGGYWSMAAALFFTVALVLQMLGATATSATNLGFLINTSAIFAPMAAWLFLNRAPDRIIWLAAITVMSGAALLAGGQYTGINWGDGLCLLAGFCYGLWIVALGRALEEEGGAAPLTLLQYLPCTVIGLGLSFGAVCAYLYLGETLTLLAAGGGVLMICGLFMLRLPQRVVVPLP
jgi:drug/metabolite transporter (DMT)-like permease